MSKADKPIETVTKTARKFTVTSSRTIKRFDRKDYPVWATHMKNILRERKLLKYIDDPDTIEDYDENEDAQALAEIQFTLSNAQTRLTLQSETAHDAWERIKSKHLHSSKSNRIFLKSQFLGLKMNDKETMTEFIARVKDMAKQLSTLSKEKVSDEDKSLVFTRGLPESYRGIIVAMQEADKLDDYEHVINGLLNEETL